MKQNKTVPMCFAQSVPLCAVPKGMCTLKILHGKSQCARAFCFCCFGKAIQDIKLMNLEKLGRANKFCFNGSTQFMKTKCIQKNTTCSVCQCALFFLLWWSSALSHYVKLKHAAKQSCDNAFLHGWHYEPCKAKMCVCVETCVPVR